MLKGISIPPPKAVDNLQHLLTDTVLEGVVLTAEDVKLRKSVVQKLDDIISKQMTGNTWKYNLYIDALIATLLK